VRRCFLVQKIYLFTCSSNLKDVLTMADILLFADAAFKVEPHELWDVKV